MAKFHKTGLFGVGVFLFFETASLHHSCNLICHNIVGDAPFFRQNKGRAHLVLGSVTCVQDLFDAVITIILTETVKHRGNSNCKA